MTAPSVYCEARLKGIAKRHDKGGDWAQITLQVQPQDLPDELWQAPLGSIFMVAFARVGDDGVAVKQEVAKPKAKAAFHSLPRVQQAGILCKDMNFHQWVENLGGSRYANRALESSESNARRFILDECKVNSRRELMSNDAGTLWDALLARFETATGRTTEARG